MWPWKQRQRWNLEQLATAIVLLVHSEEDINRSVQDIQKATSLGRTELMWEVIALRFNFARKPLLDFRDYRPAIDTLHRVFFEGVQGYYEMSDEQVATLENWLVSRITGYNEAWNSAVPEGREAGISVLRVAGKFAEFAGLPKYGLESNVATVSAAALGAAVKQMVDSVQIVVS